MNHAENKNIWSKMKEKLHKYQFGMSFGRESCFYLDG